MTRPKTPYEAASYDLNKFRERRLADRRFKPRTSADRRAQQSENEAVQTSEPAVDSKTKPDEPEAPDKA
ncbi:MAG TPA: hypothetical protein VGO51_12445 [Burkholderiaceae bacterium]|jgi:hypothetical protein|nr:hypothetical protein [Burkholderiaceae bacterium]